MTDPPIENSEPALPLPERLDLAIIGAGPAGLFSAIEAHTAAPGARIAIFERRPFAGGQVPVSGGGRCNVTNAGTVELLMSGFGRDGRWLEHAFRRFDNIKVIRWFENHGVPMKEEEHGKIYPRSDDGTHVQNAMIQEVKQRRIPIFLRTRVENILFDAATGALRGIVVSGREIPCTTLVIAAGGSGPKPTPTAGVSLAAALGHSVVPPAPALAPIKLAGRPVETLAGVSLQCTLMAGPVGFAAKKPKIKKTGDLLFTHFGLSGPVVLDLSHPIARIAGREPSEIALDCAPGIGDARGMLDQACREQGARSIHNITIPGVPRRLFEHFLSLAGVEPLRQAAQLKATEREAIAKFLKDWRFREFEVTWAGAMVSGGGVSLKEVDPRTLASRIVSGVFFAGETLDLQGDCGGFNLQASFSTGSLAGASAAAQVLAKG